MRANRLLLIGINAYRHWRPLRGPGKDIEAFKAVLYSRYGFSDSAAIDLRDDAATGDNIIRAFMQLKDCPPEDNLLIYYAGHGYTDDFDGTGYWIPHDAGTDAILRERWISNARIRGMLRNMAFRHILLVCDSCFSGDLLDEQRDLEPVRPPDWSERAQRYRSREVLTSGASEPVSDVCYSGHSAFAFHLIDTLRHCREPWIDALKLYDHIRSGVAGQQPLYGGLAGSGHQRGGAFLLYPKDAAVNIPGAARHLPKTPSVVIDEEPLFGSLALTCTETDAMIRVGPAEFVSKAGGRQMIRNLPAGRLTVRAVKDGFEPWQEEVAIAPDETVSLRIELISSGPAARITNSNGMEFVYIEPGTFMMGSPDNEPERFTNEVLHRVTLTKGYYLQTTPVTLGQWREFASVERYRTEAETGGGSWVFIDGKWVKKSGAYWDNPGFSQTDQCPVTCVSWNDVMVFVRWLSQKEKMDYRLPTEAEWEYACRAGSNTPFFFGRCLGTDQANYNGNYPLDGCPEGTYREKTTPVKMFVPNAWGLHDMHGNVWEWCADDERSYGSSAVTDPTGPSSGSYRVGRGGSWYNYARYCRSAFRYVGRQDGGYYYLGFRLARNL